MTLGDPRGIGAEIARAALPADGADAIVVGPDDLLEGFPGKTVGVGAWEHGTGDPLASTLSV